MTQEAYGGTFKSNFIWGVIQFIMPTLLLKCLEILHTFREKDSI